jgi:hypothetical protein
MTSGITASRRRPHQRATRLAWSGSVLELQMVLIPVSALSLVAAHYLAHRRRTGGKRQRILSWVATPVSVAFWVLPHIFG